MDSVAYDGQSADTSAQLKCTVCYFKDFHLLGLSATVCPNDSVHMQITPMRILFLLGVRCSGARVTKSSQATMPIASGIWIDV